MQFKKNLSLILGIAIPLGMILVVVASIYLPQMLPKIFVAPKYDFLYGVGDTNPYTVQDGKLKVDQTVDTSKTQGDAAAMIKRDKSQLLVYETQHHNSKVISVTEAKKLNLDANIQSPDGFLITQGENSGFLLGLGSSCCTYYIKGHHLSRKLNILTNGENYFYSFHFIGWIKNGSSEQR